MIGAFLKAGGLDEVQAAGDGKAQRRQNFVPHRHRPCQRIGAGNEAAHGDGPARQPLALRQSVQDGERAPRMPDEKDGHLRKAGFGTGKTQCRRQIARALVEAAHILAVAFAAACSVVCQYAKTRPCERADLRHVCEVPRPEAVHEYDERARRIGAAVDEAAQGVVSGCKFDGLCLQAVKIVSGKIFEARVAFIPLPEKGAVNAPRKSKYPRADDQYNGRRTAKDQPTHIFSSRQYRFMRDIVLRILAKSGIYSRKIHLQRQIISVKIEREVFPQ